MNKEPGLKEVDPVLSISIEAKEKIEIDIKKALVPVRSYLKHGYLFRTSEVGPQGGDNTAEKSEQSQFWKDTVAKAEPATIHESKSRSPRDLAREARIALGHIER